MTHSPLTYLATVSSLLLPTLRVALHSLFLCYHCGVEYTPYSVTSPQIQTPIHNEQICCL